MKDTIQNKSHRKKIFGKFKYYIIIPWCIVNMQLEFSKQILQYLLNSL